MVAGAAQDISSEIIRREFMHFSKPFYLLKDYNYVLLETGAPVAMWL